MGSKKELRKEALTRRGQLRRCTPHFADLIVEFAGALNLPPASILAGYWPLNSEADPRGLMNALARSGARLVLPCVEGAAEPLVFRLWREGDTMVQGACGVYEPSPAAPAVIPEGVLVPLLAFDAVGYRLGYGGGYYDRTLAFLRRTGRVLAIGVAYTGQEMTTLPREAHDAPLDMVLTERGIRRFES
jgi:5-formyltetrahydrofolate cyclo-ligase